MEKRSTYRFPFARYPAIRLLLILVAGILTAHFSGLPLICWAIPGVFVLLALGICEWTNKRLLRPGLTVCSVASYSLFVFLFGAGWYQFHTGVEPLESRLIKTFRWESLEMRGKITQIRPTSTGNIQWDLAVERTVLADTIIWQQPYTFRAVLDPEEIVLPNSAKPGPGSRVDIMVTVYPVEQPRNPHEFDYASYLESQDIAGQGGIDSVFSVEASPGEISWLALRSKVLALIEQNFSTQTASLAKALLIGHKNELKKEEKLAFSRTGLSHIMAVSGLHVGFIVGPFWLMIPLFWTWRGGRYVGLVLLAGLLSTYAGLTGFSASVCRASLTAGLITYGRLFYKARDSLNLTGVAALILLIIDPTDLFDIGFQLSFTAVFIILLTMPVVNRMLPDWIRFRWYGAPLMVVIVSILVQFGLYPILGYYFSEFSLIGPLANALIVPVLGVTVPYALALLPVSSFFPVTGLYLNLPNEYFLRFLNRLTSFGSDLPWSWIPVSVDSLLIFAIWTAGILFIASLATPALRFRLLIVFLSLLTLHQASALVKKFSVKRLSITFFDVGQGDAALVQSPAGHNYLVDTGRWSPGYNSGRYVILPHLKAEGIDRLDGIFLSHPHSDHIGGTVELLEEIAVDTLYETGFSYDSELHKRYRKTAQNKGVPLRQLQAGANLNIDPAMLILVYGPQPGPFGDDPNEHSLVLEFIYGNTEFLFTGDAGTEQERNLLQNYKPLLNSDVLKVGHHGSKTSSSDPFLTKVRPDHAVTSLELQNRFRHPHPNASLRLHNSGAHLHFTSLDRAIIFHSDGNRIWTDEW